MQKITVITTVYICAQYCHGNISFIYDRVLTYVIRHVTDNVKFSNYSAYVYRIRCQQNGTCDLPMKEIKKGHRIY